MRQVGAAKLVAFRPPLGRSYTAQWNSTTELVVVIGPTVVAADYTVSVGGAAAVSTHAALASSSSHAVGKLAVHIQAAADLRSANLHSNSSNATALVDEGTWGVAPHEVAVAQRMPRELRVTWLTPSDGFPSPSYLVRWCALAGVEGTNSGAGNKTAHDVATLGACASIEVPQPLTRGSRSKVVSTDLYIPSGPGTAVHVTVAAFNVRQCVLQLAQKQPWVRCRACSCDAGSLCVGAHQVWDDGRSIA